MRLGPRTMPTVVASVATVLVVPLLLVLAPSGAATDGRSATAVRGWSTAPMTVRRGATVRFHGRVHTGSETSPRRAVLQHRPVGVRRWLRLDAGRVRADGRVTLAATVRRAGAIRVHVPATRQARARTTRARWVRVRPRRTTWSRFESDVFRLVNELRAEGTTCGDVPHDATGAVARNGRLARAAGGYARRMAEEGYFAHVEPDGTGPGDRATAAGYDWSGIGENIAAGQETPAAVVQAWRESPSHCRNMMGDWQHLGVGRVRRAGSEYGDYWVQMFGNPG